MAAAMFVHLGCPASAPARLASQRPRAPHAASVVYVGGRAVAGAGTPATATPRLLGALPCSRALSVQGNVARLGQARRRGQPLAVRRAFRVAAASEETATKTTRQLGSEISEGLKGCAVIVVGDDGGANFEVASELAKVLGYAPLSTEKLIEKVTGETVAAIAADEGASAVGGVEYVLMQDLVSNLRVVVATAGGGIGAAARGDCWPYFFGGVTVYLDDSAEGADEMPQQEVYRQSEIQLQVKPAAERGEGWAEEAARAVLGATQQILDADEHFAGKKSLYIRLGCRGDWPELKPPGWDPEKPDEMPPMPPGA